MKHKDNRLFFFPLIIAATLLLVACPPVNKGKGSPTYRHSPKTRTELLAAIQAEIKAQNTTSPNLNNIDTSRITDMSGLFQGKATFNGDISKWNVSKVTTMANMFKGAKAFKQALKWKVNSDTVDVTDMFLNSGIESADIPGWYVKITPSLPKLYVLQSTRITNITFTKQPANMTGSFTIKPPSLPNGLKFSDSTGTISGTPQKPGSLPNPNTFYGKTTYTITFVGNGQFSDPKYTLSKKVDIGVYKYKPTTNADLKANIVTEIGIQGNKANLNNIDTSNVNDLSTLFVGKVDFNGDISKWDVSEATDMQGMFYPGAFNGDISSWNTGNVQDMNMMFSSATAFNQDISKWDVSKVTDMQGMFSDATAFNQNISKWNVSKVEKMAKMFQNATSFNQDISGWNLRNVKNMIQMFYGATKFNQNLTPWGERLPKNVTKMNVFNGSGVKTPPAWYTGNSENPSNA